MSTCKYDSHNYKCEYDSDATTGDGFCILHSPSPEKDQGAFDQALTAHRREKGGIFIGFVFPTSFTWEGAKFKEKANFAHATFTGEANFAGAEFTEKAYFGSAKFTKQAYFGSAKFTGQADFAGAEFTREAIFYSAGFFGEADFGGAEFTGKADFGGAEFTGKANFRSAKFTGQAEFWGAEFTGKADFGGAEFTKQAYFADAEFSGEANFGRARFAGEARVAGAAFTGEANFVGTEFIEEANFVGTEFIVEANFISAEFTEKANFAAAEFAKHAYFANAAFTKQANFGRATFTEKASFDSAKFTGEAIFDGAKFTGKANFAGASFSGRTLFAPTGGISGSAQIFSGVDVDFSNVIMEHPDAIIFRDADLAKCRFQGTDLRKAEITGAKWPQIGSRIGVYDEIATLPEGEPRAWHHIERLYRELKQNYEDRRDYERARDFHYGEKEMRRKNTDTSPGLRFLLTLYWLVSGYGERLLRPLIWAAVLLGVSTILYLCLGLHPKNGGPPLAWTSGWDWLRSAFYSFRVITLLRPDDLAPVGYAKLVHAVESLLGPLLLGLFALAVRQRLKR